MNFLRKIFSSSLKAKMAEIYKIASPRYGLWKRIDENRELLQYLYENCPDVVRVHPWITGWIKSNEDFFCALAATLFQEEAKKTGEASTHARIHPRPWPEIPKQRDAHSESWSEHAYPLKQFAIYAQGTRHSSTASIVEMLEVALERVKAGDLEGWNHDDDFGYRFEAKEVATGPSFFIEPYGRK